jgi:hypothetical protein
MPSITYLMLRSARRARLEARTDVDAAFQAPRSVLGIIVRCSPGPTRYGQTMYIRSLEPAAIRGCPEQVLTVAHKRLWTQSDARFTTALPGARRAHRHGRKFIGAYRHPGEGRDLPLPCWGGRPLRHAMCQTVNVYQHSQGSRPNDDYQNWSGYVQTCLSNSWG